jgi:sec-independent protein translocase protein TatC
MAESEDRKIPDEEIPEEEEMSFLDHLEELRWRILYTLIGIAVGAVICGIFIDFLVEDILLLPARNSFDTTVNGTKLQNLKPFGQLFLYVQVALISGFIISIPNVFYQLWKFIAPALRKSERKYVKAIVVFTSICFLSGVAFAYFVMLPITLKFAASFGTDMIANQFTIDEYMSIVLSVMLAAGVVFELPMASFFLSKIGILTPKFMSRYRRHAIVILLFAAAALTPGTDPVSMMILAVPLLLLYEISIFVSKMSIKKE